jgi:tRNA-specific 2-thiouridylase
LGEKIAVAMSGGVDSTVAASLLKARGYDIFGVTMRLFPSPGFTSSNKELQRLQQNIDDARAMAVKLQIPHHVLEVGEQFNRSVIDYFVNAYASGCTPNPCIQCNRLLKFGFMLDSAKNLGAGCVATGHYARIEKNTSHHAFSLKTAIDSSKDQSYFLYTLTQRQLKQALMPLGAFSKDEVRGLARAQGLGVHEKQESQEICFIETKDYRTFFEQHKPELLLPGPIKDVQGRMVGTHSGIVNYTIGQRRGLGISSHQPYYVTRIDRANNTIFVGSRDDVYHRELVADRVNWISGEAPREPLHVYVKIRSIHTPAAALLYPEGGAKMRIRFENPQWAVTPGQSAVCYDGDDVLGGGTIVEGR